MIFTLYRLLICVVAAHYAGPWLDYMINDVPVPNSTAVWACALLTLFLFERLYISIRMEHEMKAEQDELGRPD